MSTVQLSIADQKKAAYEEGNPEGYDVLLCHECYMNSHSQLVMWCIMRRLSDGKLVAFQYEMNSEESQFDYGEVFEIEAIKVPSVMFVPTGVAVDDEDSELAESLGIAERTIQRMNAVAEMF